MCFEPLNIRHFAEAAVRVWSSDLVISYSFLLCDKEIVTLLENLGQPFLEKCAGDLSSNRFWVVSEACLATLENKCFKLNIWLQVLLKQFHSN